MTGRRITLVADELRGIQGGGLGTVFTYLAIALARLGHAVEVLYFGDAPATIEPAWASTYERWGVGVHVLPPTAARIEPAHLARLLDVDRALEARKPEVVIAQDLAGAAYVSLRRRQLGLGHEETLFIVRCSGTRRWITDAARKVRVHPGALAVTALEQAALELADVVVAESRYMVEWMRAQGWRLPDATHVIPSVLDAGATGESPPRAELDADGRVRRIVYFGRLEDRKGLAPFLDAVNALDPETLAGIELEFLGPATPAWPPARVREILSERSASALAAVRFTTVERQEALDRLRRPGTLAVMPSLEDNSPSTVYECLQLGIPFVASAVGGTAELVDHADAARVLFEPTPTGIEQALTRALREPAHPARPAFDDAESLRRWTALVASRPGPRPRASERPRVEVIVTGREPGDGAAASAALARGTYDNFELKVAEPGSRHAAAERSNAPWIVFLAADDVPHEDLLETLVQAQGASGADVVTCGVTLVDGTSRLFLGDAGGLGAVANGYGTVALIRRSLVERALDTAWPADADPDWPLLAGLSTRGAQIVAIPTPLVSRTQRPGESRTAPGDALLAVAELERVLPASANSLARLAAGLAAADVPAPPSGGWLARQARRLRTR